MRASIVKDKFVNISCENDFYHGLLSLDGPQIILQYLSVDEDILENSSETCTDQFIGSYQLILPPNYNNLRV